MKRKARIKSIGAAALTSLLLLAACPTGNEPEKKPEEEPGNPTSYTVTFSRGTGTGTPPATQTVAPGATITLPEQGDLSAPEGETFDGWKHGETSHQPGATFTVTANTTFVAQWKTIIDPNKTYIEFENLEDFPVIVFSDPDRQTHTKVAQVPAKGKTLIETEPKPQGTVFYPRFLLEFEGIQLSYDGAAIRIRVDEKKVNKASIPKLTSIETGSAFVKIENKGVYSLTFNKENHELSPLGVASGIVMSGESAAYQIEPGAASPYKVMENGSVPVEIPPKVTTFSKEMIYTFEYTGGILTLKSAIEVFEALTRSKTITFEADGGTPAIQTRTVTSGDSVGSANMPSEPVRIGYTFGGWYTQQNSGGSQFTGATTVSGNITVYAKWTVIQYTVTFNADGGSPATETRAVVEGASVDAANMPTEPTKSGYTFDGWYTARNGGGSEFTADTTVSGDITVYAKWFPQYTVTFNADSSSPTTETRAVNSGDLVGSSNMPSGPTRIGYSFGGWYTARNGGGSEFTADTTVSGDITVYAKWMIQYTVTFNADGGSPGTETRMVAEGASVDSANMPTEPTKTGYTFEGWYTGTNGGGSQFTADTPVIRNTTVYAKWKPGGSVQILLRPTLDPPFSNTSVSVHEQAPFSAGSGYGSYQWYWDGVAIEGANTSAYTLETNSKDPGIYELSVIVTSGAGERLSARCRVTITAY